MSAPPTSDAISDENIDPVAPSDVMRLKVVESFFIGDETYIKANVLLVGFSPNSGSATWLKKLYRGRMGQVGKEYGQVLIL